MGGTEREEESGTPPYRQRFSPCSNECDDHKEEGALNSSTSTVGPPGSQGTGLYQFHHHHHHHRHQHHLWESGSNTSDSSPDSSTQRAYHRSGASRRTGSYRAMFSGNRNSMNNGRSLSNTSTVVSFMGSVPEWSRSFCLFNPARAAASRHSLRFSHQLLFNGRRNAPGGGSGGSGGMSSPATTSPTAGHTTPRMEHHRPSVSYSMSMSMGVGPTALGADCGRSSSTLFAAGQPLVLSAPSSPTVAAYYAMGGFTRMANKSGSIRLSPVRKELPMLLCSLCSYLSLTGTPIISGDIDHPMDTRKGPLIGVGGFAKVYAGIDCVSGNLVAIKEINISEVDDHAALRTIGKEFDLLKSLRHPNIVSYQLFKHSASQKVCRIVMELLTGGSTLTLLEKYGPLREPILRKFSRHLLQAIAFIHKKGFTHRDIKPANILVSHNGVVKLCDFGCSKRVNELSKSSSCIIGTPLYMAPEFIKGEANHKSDIWSMACSLFELGTGLLPWYHAGVRDNLPLMFYITTTSETPLVFPPQDGVQEFSPEFMDFMEQCFTRDVSKRPEASELLKHPWITGVHSMLPDVSHSTVGGIVNPNRRSGSGSIDEELLCQLELEDVSAFISTEMCNMWMMGNSTAMSSVPVGVMPQQPEVQSGGNYPLQQPLERRLLDSQMVTLGSQCQSPVVSSRGGGGLAGIGAAPISPTVSLDHALHDNFNYTIPLGSSAGCFVLPSCSSPWTVASAPQYLRINPDGSLDFATAEEDDAGDVDLEVEDAMTVSHRYSFFRSPSFNMAMGVGSPLSAGGGFSVMPPSTTVSHYMYGGAGVTNLNNNSGNNNTHSSFSNVRNSAMWQARHVSVAQNQSLSLTSNCSLPSRGVSPSRRSLAASSVSLTTSQQLPNLLGVSSSTPAQHLGSLNQSSDDVVTDAHGGAHSSSAASWFPENVKLDTTGRLRMSLTVPNGGPERCVNISLSIDPEDVQRRVIERRQSYVVSLSDDVKMQLTEKMQELASSGVNNLVDVRASGSVNGMHRRLSNGTHGESSVSLSPSISPARRSMGGSCQMRHSHHLKRGSVVDSGNMAEETGEVRGDRNTTNNSSVGSFASVTHLSSDVEDRRQTLL